MATPYSDETRKILHDFLETLSADQRIDPGLLAELRTMLRDGLLENRGRIQQALSLLEARADELYHR